MVRALDLFPADRWPVVPRSVAVWDVIVAKGTVGEPNFALPVSPIQSLTTNGHYVEDTANTLAAGDIGIAEQLILSTGYTLRGHAGPGPRSFEVVTTGPGWAHIRAKKTLPAGPEGHLWRFGITTAKGTPPTTLITRFTLAVDILLSDFPSNSILGVQHASILPTPRAATKAAKTASPKALTASGHVVASYTVADPYQWTGFLYTAIP